jgi:hypothetical protein
MMMKIPSFLYGPYSKVKGVCRRKAKELRCGARFVDLPAGQWLDTATTSGSIVVDGPSRSFSRQKEQFCCFALAVAISDEWDGVPWAEQRDTIWAAYHEAAMLEPWLFLGLLGQLSRDFLDQRPEWPGPFVRAAVKFWPLFTAEGARYTKNVDTEDLWSLTTNIKFALGRLGVPREKLIAPLPPGGLITLAREVLPDLKEE